MLTLSFFRRRFLKVIITVLLLIGVNFSIYAENRSKILVIYLSRTQNNKVLAEFIAHTLSADLVEIKTQQPYPKNYQLMRMRVIKELSNNILPPLAGSITIEQYQQIFIVFPTWAMRLPPPIKTFLATHDFNGKIIKPLNTHAGYGVGSGFDEIKNLASGAKVQQGLSLKGGNERDGNPFVMQGEKLRQAKHKIKEWL